MREQRVNDERGVHVLCKYHVCTCTCTVCAYVVAMVMSPQVYIPLPLPEEGESPSFQYSAVECALFAFHQMVQKVLHHHYIITKSQVLYVSEFLSAEENTERFKD